MIARKDTSRYLPERKRLLMRRLLTTPACTKAEQKQAAASHYLRQSITPAVLRFQTKTARGSRFQRSIFPFLSSQLQHAGQDTGP